MVSSLAITGNQLFSGLLQVLAGHLFQSHVSKFGFEDGSDIGESRIENLHHRPVMADQVNDKRLSHGVVEGPLPEKHQDIEEIPWVLAIQRGADLPRVQLIFRKRSTLHGKFK